MATILLEVSYRFMRSSIIIGNFAAVSQITAFLYSTAATPSAGTRASGSRERDLGQVVFPYCPFAIVKILAHKLLYVKKELRLRF
jgi:hypothetical protein